MHVRLCRSVPETQSAYYWNACHQQPGAVLPSLAETHQYACIIVCLQMCYMVSNVYKSVCYNYKPTPLKCMGMRTCAYMFVCQVHTQTGLKLLSTNMVYVSCRAKQVFT